MAIPVEPTLLFMDWMDELGWMDAYSYLKFHIGLLDSLEFQ